MTITSTPSEITYAGDGVSTVFTIPFVFDTSADLKVVETVAGLPTVVTTGFSIAGGAGLTGTLTRSVVLPVGTNILILDNPALTQPVDYVDNDRFPAATHEGALDRVTRLVKRLNERVDRSLRVADGDLIDGDNNLLPIVSARQGKYLVFGVSGAPTVASGTGNDTALRTDLANGVASLVKSTAVKYDRTAAEIAAGVTPVAYQYLPGYLYRYGTNTVPGTTDMTTALSNCYAACKAARRVPMIIPAEVQLFSSQLAWDGSVDVLGENGEFSTLRKNGNFDGILISGSGQQSRYQDFNVDKATSTSGVGIQITGAAHLTLQRVSVINQPSHGIELSGGSDTGFFANYLNLILTGNGGDGLRIGDHHFASYFEDIDTRGNTGWGVKLLGGAKYHVGKQIICQQNVAGGAEIAGSTNSLEIYGESNTGTDISLTAASVNNNISILHADTQADFADLGTNNQGSSISAPGVGYFTPGITRPKRTTNVAGLDVYMAGGAAGTGGSPFKGGTASVFGGDSAGTGNLNGGDVVLRGGSGTGTGIEGDVILQPGTGQIKVGVPLVALGGGAAPTLGTIGGSGPTAAAQNKWLQLKDSAGATMWVPIWK